MNFKLQIFHPFTLNETCLAIYIPLTETETVVAQEKSNNVKHLTESNDVAVFFDLKNRHLTLPFIKLKKIRRNKTLSRNYFTCSYMYREKSNSIEVRFKTQVEHTVQNLTEFKECNEINNFFKSLKISLPYKLSFTSIYEKCITVDSLLTGLNGTGGKSVKRNSG